MLDSQTGAGGLGCLVLARRRRRRAGRRAGRGRWTASARPRETLDIWFCLDTLEYLRRGGRIGAAQAMVGTALKIKPILTFGTEIAPVGRVRTHRRAFERMVAYLHELHERGASDWIVQHAQAPADAEQLVAEGSALFGFEPLFCTEVGPVLGAHLGSGMLVGGMSPHLSSIGPPAVDPCERTCGAPARWMASAGIVYTAVTASGALWDTAPRPRRGVRCRAQAISLRNGTSFLKNSLSAGVAPAGSLCA